MGVSYGGRLWILKDIGRGSAAGDARSGPRGAKAGRATPANDIRTDLGCRVGFRLGVIEDQRPICDIQCARLRSQRSRTDRHRKHEGDEP